MRTLSTSTPLEQFIVEQRQQKDILLMSHTVLGHSSFQDNYCAIDALVKAGVKLIELQFPFSEAIYHRKKQRHMLQPVTIMALPQFFYAHQIALLSDYSRLLKAQVE